MHFEDKDFIRRTKSITAKGPFKSMSQIVAAIKRGCEINFMLDENVRLLLSAENGPYAEKICYFTKPINNNEVVKKSITFNHEHWYISAKKDLDQIYGE